MRVIGQCKLCLREGVELRESHFISKSAYKLVEKLGGVTPLIVRGDITVQKNDQMKAPLLCADCEDLFNKNGESWVLRYCNRPNTGFKLHDLVRTVQPEVDQPDLKMYATSSIAEIEGEKLTYFLLSVLWRGSVHSWKWGKDDQETPNLGSRYEEEFRKYLLGESDFPKNAAVHVYILANPDLWSGFTVPFRQKLSDGLWRYTFNFLGISFRCFLGNVLNETMRKVCIRSPHKYIFLGVDADRILVRDFRPTLLSSKPLGAIKTYPIGYD